MRFSVVASSGAGAGPPSSRSESSSSNSRWIALRNGRAPYCGSKPAFARYWTASSDTSSFTPWARIRRATRPSTSRVIYATNP
jgi:hypothetical protein